MTIHVHARVHAVCLTALLGFVTFGLPADTFAQASTDKVHVARRLGGASRFTPAVRTIQNLQKTFARPRTQRDITTVLKLAELSHLEAEVKKAIADGAVREVTFAPGSTLQWMALRRGGTRPCVLPPTFDEGVQASGEPRGCKPRLDVLEPVLHSHDQHPPPHARREARADERSRALPR